MSLYGWRQHHHSTQGMREGGRESNPVKRSNCQSPCPTETEGMQQEGARACWGVVVGWAVRRVVGVGEKGVGEEGGGSGGGNREQVGSERRERQKGKKGRCAQKLREKRHSRQTQPATSHHHHPPVCLPCSKFPKCQSRLFPALPLPMSSCVCRM